MSIGERLSRRECESRGCLVSVTKGHLMAYTNNKFCWHGVISTDTTKAQAFYTEVLGWKASTVPMGEGSATMFAAADIPRAHLAAPQTEGVPSYWENYLRVEDVDASTKAALAHGGKELVPPTNIPPGRFSIVTSPTGAQLALFHEADSSATNPPPGPGSIHWVELHSTDIKADIAWMEATFGISTKTMPMPNGSYYILSTGSEDNMLGGAMQGEAPGVPSHWLAWVEVADLEDTLKRVAGHDGKVLTDIMEIESVGRIAVVQDPTGGTFGVIKPANA